MIAVFLSAVAKDRSLWLSLKRNRTLGTFVWPDGTPLKQTYLLRHGDSDSSYMV